MTAKPIAAMSIASTGPAPTTSTARWRTACSEHQGPRARRARHAIPVAVLLSLLLTACGAPTPQTAFNPRSDYAAEGFDLFQLIIVIGVMIGVLVEGVLIWAATRYRRRDNHQLPPQIHGNTIVEIAWTTGPVIVVGYILFLTLPVIFQTQAPAPSSSMNVEVIGHQFWWEFHYPDANVDTANELHLPVGRTVNLVLHSNDVIHSFWIPALGASATRSLDTPTSSGSHPTRLVSSLASATSCAAIRMPTCASEPSFSSRQTLTPG
jgi:hypothetical protein